MINLDDIGEDFLKVDLVSYKKESEQEQESSKCKGDKLEAEQSKEARSDTIPQDATTETLEQIEETGVEFNLHRQRKSKEVAAESLDKANRRSKQRVTLHQLFDSIKGDREFLSEDRHGELPQHRPIKSHFHKLKNLTSVNILNFKCNYIKSL